MPPTPSAFPPICTLVVHTFPLVASTRRSRPRCWWRRRRRHRWQVVCVTSADVRSGSSRRHNCRYPYGGPPELLWLTLWPITLRACAVCTTFVRVAPPNSAAPYPSGSVLLPSSCAIDSNPVIGLRRANGCPRVLRARERAEPYPSSRRRSGRSSSRSRTRPASSPGSGRSDGHSRSSGRSTGPRTRSSHIRQRGPGRVRPRCARERVTPGCVPAPELVDRPLYAMTCPPSVKLPPVADSCAVSATGTVPFVSGNVTPPVPTVVAGALVGVPANPILPPAFPIVVQSPYRGSARFRISPAVRVATGASCASVYPATLGFEVLKGSGAQRRRRRRGVLPVLRRERH